MNRLSLFLALLPGAASAQVRYTLTPEPENKSVRVSITAKTTAPQTAFRIPAWVPGFYVILDNQKKISDAKAFDSAGKPLTVLHEADPRQWVVKTPSPTEVTFNYRVLGDDPGLGFFAVNVRPKTAFVNGPAAFMYIEGRKEEPTFLKIQNPEGWQVGTSMTMNSDGSFKARDYDELVDHPIDLGIFTKRSFQEGGVTYVANYMTMGDPFPGDRADQETARLQQLVRPAIRMFGGAPFKKYVFHIHLQVGNFGGGLEHQASVTMATPNRTPLGIDDLVTHEFMHAWNVKNIRPKVLGPFDYTKEVRTDNLWFAEGVTDYYAKLHAYQSGLNGVDSYLFPAFSREIKDYQNGTTRLDKTLAEASRGAWEGGSQGTGDLSYYNKGQLVGWILDAMIRTRTNGKKSLDDVFRFMMSKYHLPAAPGYEENGILQAINQVSGQDFSELYKKMVYTTEELPYELLQNIGLKVVYPDQDYLTLGFKANEQGIVEEIDTEMSDPGLQLGDRIISVNGVPYGPLVKNVKPEGYWLSIRRGEESDRLQVRPVVKHSSGFFVYADPAANDQQAALREGWLQRPGGIK